MFYEDGYPDWIDEMYNDFGNKVKQVGLDEDVWNLIRGMDEPPHIGNHIAYLLLSNIVGYILSTIKDDEIRDEIESLFHIEVNGHATYLTFDSDEYVAYSDLMEAVKEKIDELEVCANEEEE